MVLDFAKEAIANAKNIKFDKIQTIGVKDGWNYCSECGFLEPLTDEEIEFEKKRGTPKEFLIRKNHKRFEGRTISLARAKAIHSFVDDWMKDIKEEK